MADVSMQITIDDADVVAMLGRAPAAVQQRLRELIEGSAIETQREMRIEAPIAVTGDLRGSIRYSYSAAAMSAVISPNVPYADDVEKGGPARYVSVAPGSSLRAWAVQKGLNPDAVRNSIAKKGTKAHPFVQPTYDKMKPIVEEDITAGMIALVEELNA